MNDDGIALQSVEHPVEITKEMLAAGVAAAHKTWGRGSYEEAVAGIFLAMSSAAPSAPEDLNEEAIEAAVIEIEGYEEVLERFATRIALGPGRDWPAHYPEDRKEYWRRFVREIAIGLSIARIEDRDAPQRTGASSG